MSNDVSKSLSRGWRIVRFGDVVCNVREIERDPLAAGIERYVGLEHMEPENLQIKSWGLVAEGTTFTQRFRRGQVLFGKRRAYQRKVAVAEFDGICSGDILVFESKDDRLLPELLPFIVQSEGFFANALRTSSGSLSPRTRWRDLAAYEFPLPPLEAQRRIADILWAADAVVTAAETAIAKLEDLAACVLEQTITGGWGQSSRQEKDGQTPAWEQVRLGELLIDARYGMSKRSGPRRSGSIPVLRIPNVVGGRLDLSDLSWVRLTPEEQERYSVTVGDVLLVRTNGNPAYVGRSVAIETTPDDAVFASYLIRLRVDETRIRPLYLSTLLNSRYLQRPLRHEVRSTAGNYNINTKGLSRLKVPLPPIPIQDKMLAHLQQLNSAKAGLQEHLLISKALKSQLLKQLLQV